MTPLVREGYRSARRLTRLHARSFYLASALLFGARRRAAFALYAFCRRLDDVVDTGPKEGLPQRVSGAARVVEALFAAGADADTRLPASGPWEASELAALQDTLRRFCIPKAPFVDLLLGMEMDVHTTRYQRFAELERYCDCVAGTVGLMLCPVLGAHQPAALAAATDLGRAMQLTNILRDAKEDLARGRVYLPEEELQAFGLTVEDLHLGRVDDRMRAFLRWQIARARALYARAAFGIGFLRGFGTRRMVRLMGALYGGILNAIEEQGYDVFSARARVPWQKKLALVVRALVRPGSLLKSAPRAPAFLVPPAEAGLRAAARLLEAEPGP